MNLALVYPGTGHELLIRATPGDLINTWFQAKECCEIVGHSDVSMALKPLKPSEKKKYVTQVQLGSHKKPRARRTQKMWYINFPGLLKLILRSRKPEAQRFQDWVCYDVLPSVLTTGHYALPEAREAKQLEIIRAIQTLTGKVCALQEGHEVLLSNTVVGDPARLADIIGAAAGEAIKRQ